MDITSNTVRFRETANLLELLANDAPAEEYRRLAERARESRASDEADRWQRDTLLALQLRARLEHACRRNAELRLLTDSVRDLAWPEEVDSLLKLIIRKARVLVDAEVSCLMLRERDMLIPKQRVPTAR